MREQKYDFVKGIAVSFVILLHTLSKESLNNIGHIFHIGQAVPLFILVTFILSFSSLSKKEGNEISYWYSKKRWKVLLVKIWLPYLIMQGVFFVILLFMRDDKHLHSMLLEGGIGPGCYYPWIYFQFWLIMPFIYKLLDSKSLFLGGVLLFILNEILQICCCYIDVSSYFYSKFPGRYLFLAFLGYLFIHKRISIYCYSLFLLIGIAYYLSLGKVEYEPWLCNKWMSQQLPAYFYTIVILQLLIKLYGKIKNNWICKKIVLLGEYSWYVFLLQMFFITITNESMLSFINDCFFRTILYIAVIYLLCVIPIIVYDRYKRSFV